MCIRDRVFRVDWHLPQGTERPQFDLLMEQHFPAMLNKYKQLPFSYLGGKTISEAAQLEEYRCGVQGLLYATTVFFHLSRFADRFAA